MNYISERSGSMDDCPVDVKMPKNYSNSMPHWMMAHFWSGRVRLLWETSHYHLG